MSGTVLITGGGARIGRAIATALAQDGWHVIIHYGHSEDKAEELAESLRRDGGQASIVNANLHIPQDLNSLIDRAADSAGTPVTALINNASTFSPDAARTFTRATFDHHFDVNFYAPINLAQSFAAQLPEGQAGQIINLIDQKVFNLNGDFFTYTLSKAALHIATQTLAQSLAPQIRVNGIGPGPTLQSVHQSEEEFDAEKAKTLTGEGSPPETIVQAVRYLLSASAVTGQMIAVDGGQHLYRPQDD